MTKEEIIAQIAEDAGTTKVQAKAALESFIGSVKKTLKKGERLTLVGFGSFSVSKRGARMGRNPKTGAAIEIKARKAAKFKASKELIDDAKLGCTDLVFKEVCLEVLARARNILSDKQFNKLVAYAAEKMKDKITFEVPELMIQE